MVRRAVVAITTAGLCMMALPAMADQARPGQAKAGQAEAGQANAVDCAKVQNAQRSECAKAVGQTRDNQRTNKGAAATGADRSGAVHDLNAAREKAGGKKD